MNAVSYQSATKPVNDKFYPVIKITSKDKSNKIIIDEPFDSRSAARTRATQEIKKITKPSGLY